MALTKNGAAFHVTPTPTQARTTQDHRPYPANTSPIFPLLLLSHQHNPYFILQNVSNINDIDNDYLADLVPAEQIIDIGRQAHMQVKFHKGSGQKKKKIQMSHVFECGI